MKRKQGKYYLQHFIVALLMLIMTCTISPVKAEAANARIKINTITNKTKTVKGSVKIPGKKNGKYRVVLKIGKHKYSKKCNKKGVFKIKLKKRYPVKTRVKIVAYRKAGKKWKQCGYRYLKVKKYVKKKVTSGKKAVKVKRADGLYYRKASSKIRYYYYTGSTSAHDDVSINSEKMKKKHYYQAYDSTPCYRYYYKGKWYDSYDLPYKTEIALARKSKYLKEYFKYFDYYKKNNSKAQSVLYAMYEVAANNHWYYKVTNNGDWSELLISQKGQCEAYAETLNYLAYISGVDCVRLSGSYDDLKNHAWNALKCNGSWYHVDVVGLGQGAAMETWDVSDLELLKQNLTDNYYLQFGNKVSATKNNNKPYTFGIRNYNLASGKQKVTKSILLNSKGKSQLKTAGTEYLKKVRKQLEKRKKATEGNSPNSQVTNIIIKPENWTYNNITNAIEVGQKKSLSVTKTLNGRKLLLDYDNHKNYRSSNPEVAKVVSQKFGNTTLYYVYGVSPGTVTITADIEGTTIKWDVTVIQ